VKQPTEYRTMTRKHSNRSVSQIKAMVAEDGEFLRPMVRAVIQEFLEAEMAQAVGAEKGERVEGRLSYRSGYYTRSLVTRVNDSSRSQWAVFHRDFRALSAQREAIGGGAYPDVHPRRIDSEGQSNQRRALRAQF
jgi:Transposase, Mutator family